MANYVDRGRAILETGLTGTVLVTGGAGFIGSNFVQHLLSCHPECHVVVMDKLTYAGDKLNLGGVIDHPHLEFVEGDICDRELVNQVMASCRWVLNFAAETHVDRSILDPGAFVRTDVIGTYTLLDVAQSLGTVSRFVQISTDEVYGNAEAPDGTSRPSLETDALMPLSPYAASKAGADRLAYYYWATYGLPVVITRCSNNYGPRQYPEKQIPLFITNALSGRPLPLYGDGRNTRDWIHVLDHCRALQLILEAPGEQVDGEVFNIGGAEERSILANAELILDILGLPHDLINFVADRSGHVRRHAVDSSKLQQRLGWRPSTRFLSGIDSTISWYKNNGVWLDGILARQDSFLQGALALAEITASGSGD
jgi:dTDP-glucose 4,6-dehydratase